MERSSADPFLGQMVGSYRLVEQIGQGGMGHVYRAVHSSIGQVVAIKVLARDRAGDPRAHERFLKEAKLLSQLQHPGLVQVFDFGQLESGDSYIMMELLAGESLRTYLRAKSAAPAAVPVRLALAITGQVASALAMVHERGVIHRDIKPDNIILTPDRAALGGQRVRLIDFGIARLISDHALLTEEGAAIGTATYMSPEQCLGEADIDAASDVYSLGIVLYEMLAGAPPFVGGSREVMQRHITNKPPSLRGRVEELPESVVVLLARMLDKQAERRPAVRQIADLLETNAAMADSERQTNGTSLEAEPGKRISGSLTGLPYAAGRQSGQMRNSDQAHTRSSLHLAASHWVGARARRGAIVSSLGMLILLGTTGSIWQLRTRSKHPVTEADFEPISGDPAPTPRLRIPAGEFVMGSDTGQIQQDLDACRLALAAAGCDIIQREQPTRRVQLSALDLDESEVTNRQFATWLNRHPGLTVKAKEKVLSGETLLARLDIEYGDLQYIEGSFRVRKGTADRPVIQITWNAAQLYCSEHGGSLPTEAQWEFAARGSAGRTFPWGASLPRCEGVVFGRETGQACSQLPSQRESVGSRTQDRTPEGVYDLAGNVAEWVYDCLRIPYPMCSGGMCQDPAEDLRPGEKSCDRVFRGNSWTEMALLLKGTRRSRRSQSGVGASIGFRCAYPVAGQKSQAK